MTQVTAPNGVDLAAGDTVRMQASSSPACSAADSIIAWSWSVPDTTIATVSSSGLVTGLVPGAALIQVTGTTAAGGTLLGGATLHIKAVGLRIDPAAVMIDIRQPFTFRAFRQGTDVPEPVRWSLSNPDAGRITAAGVLTPCWPPRGAQVQAQAIADTVLRGESAVSVVSTADAVVWVQAILDAVTGAAAPLDSLRNDVDVVITVAGDRFVCRTVRQVTLSVADSRGVVVQAAIDSTPPPHAMSSRGLRFRPSSLVDGVYVLTATAWLDGRLVELSNPVAVQIRH